MLIKIKYTGSRNFIVESYNASGEQIDLLVNTIGEYQGTRLLDIGDNDHTSRLLIQSSGPWEITIVPLEPSNIRIEKVPSTFEGNGDDVLVITGTPDLIKVDVQGRGNFIVFAWTNTDRDLLFNEIAPYQGTKILNSKTIILEIIADGPWKIEVTGK